MNQYCKRLFRAALAGACGALLLSSAPPAAAAMIGAEAGVHGAPPGFMSSPAGPGAILPVSARLVSIMDGAPGAPPPGAYSLAHVVPPPLPWRAGAPPRRHAGFHLFGYASAEAEELVRLPPPARRPELVFTHPALGTAVLHVADADVRQSEHPPGPASYDASTADLQLPPPPPAAAYSPLPIPLLVLMVLLPAGLVLAQGLFGNRGTPRNALKPLDHR